MKNLILFSIAGLLCIGAVSGQGPDKKTVVKMIENSAAYTIEVASLMPASEYTYSPTSEGMSFGPS